MRHPAISEDANVFLTPEDEFAKLAYETLAHYGVTCQDVEAGVSYPVTDRIEVSEDEEPVVRALRLRRTVATFVSSPQYHTIAAGDFLKDEGPSEEYIVIELQHGQVSRDEIDSTEPLVDEDFTWSPYVVTIFKTGGEDDYQLDIVDGSTGEGLSFHDLFIATNALRHLSTWLYCEMYEDGLENDDSIAMRTLHAGKVQLDQTETFDPEQIDLNYSCVECGEDNGVCDHNLPKMN